MRKLTVICVIMMLFLQVFSGTVAYGEGEPEQTAANNIVVDRYELSDSKTTISEDDEVNIRLYCTNISGAAIAPPIRATIDSSSSFSGGSTITSDLYTEELPGDESTASKYFMVKYKGSGKEIKIKFTYKIGDKYYAEEESFDISEAEPTGTGGGDNGGGGSVDPSRYTPRLGTATGDIPVITAGSLEDIKFTIKNNSIYQAKNITMTLKMADDAKAPTVMDNMEARQIVDRISGDESKEVTFSVRTKKTAPEGTYAMNLTYQFQGAYGGDFEKTETVYIKIRNSNTYPKLVVNNIAVKQAEDSSGTINLELKIKNMGDLAAKDIKFTLKGLKSGGFTAHNSTDVKFLEKISGNATGAVVYSLMPPTAAAEGSNDLSVKMDYKDESGNTYTEENQIFLPAGEGDATRPSIGFENISAPDYALGANESFDIKLDLKNNGGTAAKNIKVSLTSDKEIVTKSMSPVYIEKLDAQTGKTISFNLFATEEAVTKNYPIAISIEYEDAFGQKYNASQYVGAYVENGSSKTVPRIIVNKYSIEPSSVNAGSDFELKLSFLNTSRTADITNIKVNVLSEDGTFTPTEGGNTFFIERIPTRSSEERGLTMHVKPDAEQKSYILTVNFEYEDDKGNPYTSKETISVRVLQNPRLATGELSLPPEAYVGQPLSLYIDFYNMGKSTLYNMMVKAEGDFQGQNINYYVGNFESGRTDYYDVSVTPNKAGELKGNIIFSFEDANGETSEIRKEFTVNVMEMVMEAPALDENGMPIDKNGVGVGGGPAAQKTNILIYVIPAAVVLIAAVVVFIILRKRHIRRKEMTLDE